MSSKPLSVTLNTGASMASLGLGTWQGHNYQDTPASREETKKSILEAIKLGYRHIDTASAYQTEGAVGDAIRESGIPREEFFVVTKLWNTQHGRVRRAFETSLQKLGLDYVDLYLMHWPIAYKYEDDDSIFVPTNEDGTVKVDRSVNFIDTWKEMEKIPKHKARAIGVSNFSEKTLDELLPHATIIPAVNQVELHPYLQQHSLRSYSSDPSKNIIITSYSALGQGDLSVLEENAVRKIASKHGITPAQVVLSWIAVGRKGLDGATVVVKSSNLERLRSNFEVVQLDEEDMQVIKTLDRNKRLAVGRDPNEHVFGWTYQELGW